MSEKHTPSAVEHGIREAVYSNSPVGFHPVLFCLCDWSTGHAYNWEEAGAELDEHLKEATKSSPADNNSPEVRKARGAM